MYKTVTCNFNVEIRCFNEVFTDALIYSRFKPTGTALVTLKRPDFLRENLRLLDNISISGTLLKARPAVFDDPSAAFPRGRGAKGREDAAARGVLDGNGPHAGIGNNGKNVMVWGFPGKTEKLAVKYIVRDFDLARNNDGEFKVFKIEQCVGFVPFSNVPN